MNDTWALDLHTLRWHRLAVDGALPAPRERAAAALVAGQLLVFGGHAAGKRLNDLCVLDLATATWGAWASVLGQPSPREAAAMCAGHGNLLFLHGGLSNVGLSDLWVYDQKAEARDVSALAAATPRVRLACVGSTMLNLQIDLIRVPTCARSRF